MYAAKIPGTKESRVQVQVQEPKTLISAGRDAEMCALATSRNPRGEEMELSFSLTVSLRYLPVRAENCVADWMSRTKQEDELPTPISILQTLESCCCCLLLLLLLL